MGAPLGVAYANGIGPRTLVGLDVDERKCQIHVKTHTETG